MLHGTDDGRVWGTFKNTFFLFPFSRSLSLIVSCGVINQPWSISAISTVVEGYEFVVFLEMENCSFR